MIVACLRHAGLGLVAVYPTLRDFVACEGLIGCRVFDTYVLLASPRALHLRYLACADVLPLARMCCMLYHKRFSKYNIIQHKIKIL